MNKHINKNKKTYKKPAVPEVTDSSTNRQGRRVKQLSPFKQKAIKVRIEIEKQKKEGWKTWESPIGLYAEIRIIK